MARATQLPALAPFRWRGRVQTSSLALAVATCGSRGATLDELGVRADAHGIAQAGSLLNV
jgi:hypothetical protein